MCGSDQEHRESHGKEGWREGKADGRSFRAAFGESKTGSVVWRWLEEQEEHPYHLLAPWGMVLERKLAATDEGCKCFGVLGESQVSLQTRRGRDC